MPRKKRSTANLLTLVWDLRCPHCQGRKAEFWQPGYVPPVLTCGWCGRLSAADAWQVAAFEGATDLNQSYLALLIRTSPGLYYPEPAPVVREEV